MKRGSLPAGIKRTSVLRRVPTLDSIRFQRRRGYEGDICAFELPGDARPITVEAPSGRMMAIAPSDVFLGTPGYREATRSVCGQIPAGGLVPGKHYWVLAASGVVGELLGDSPLGEGYVERVRYLGTICGDCGETLNIRRFAVSGSSGEDRNAPVYLIVGTAGEAGKTTAGVAVLRALLLQDHTKVIVLKATGGCAVAEIAKYQDFGAEQAFDCVDFGLPGVYPAGRKGIGRFFDHVLDYCFALPADAVLVECGGDLISPNALKFLSRLKARRADPKVVLAAVDALGALAAKQALAEQGLTISLVTGPCTDTLVLRERTAAVCGIPAVNLFRSAEPRTRLNVSSVTAKG